MQNIRLVQGSLVEINMPKSMRTNKELWCLGYCRPIEVPTHLGGAGWPLELHDGLLCS
jgi:hypothetical protein